VSDSAGSRERVRLLRYRLGRQGMLEIDEWLAPLEPLLESADGEMLTAIAGLLELETAELLDMMHGRRPLPRRLRAVLSAGAGRTGRFARKVITSSGLGMPKRCINRP